MNEYEDAELKENPPEDPIFDKANFGFLYSDIQFTVVP